MVDGVVCGRWWAVVNGGRVYVLNDLMRFAHIHGRWPGGWDRRLLTGENRGARLGEIGTTVPGYGPDLLVEDVELILRRLDLKKGGPRVSLDARGILLPRICEP